MGITRVKTKNIDSVMKWNRTLFSSNGTFDPIGTGVAIAVAGSGCTQLTLASGSSNDDGFLAIVYNFSSGSVVVTGVDTGDVTIPEYKAALFYYDSGAGLWQHLDVDIESSGGGSTYTWTLSDGTTSTVVDSGETITVADGTGVHAAVVGNTLNIRGNQEWSDGTTSVNGVSHVTLSGATITETAANEITVDIAGGGGSWYLESDAGTVAVDDGDTLELKGANGLEVLKDDTDSVKVYRDFAQNELMHPLKNGDFSRKSELNSSLPHLWEDYYGTQPGYREAYGSLPEPARGDELINQSYNSSGVYCNAQLLPVQPNTPYVLGGWAYNGGSAELFVTVQLLDESEIVIADPNMFAFNVAPHFRDPTYAQPYWDVYNVLTWRYCDVHHLFWAQVPAQTRAWSFFFDMIKFVYGGRDRTHYIKLGLWTGNTYGDIAGWSNVDMRHEIFGEGWAVPDIARFPLL